MHKSLPSIEEYWTVNPMESTVFNGMALTDLGLYYDSFIRTSMLETKSMQSMHAISSAFSLDSKP